MFENLESIENTRVDENCMFMMYEFERAVFMYAHGLSEDDFERLEMLTHVLSTTANGVNVVEETVSMEVEEDEPSALDLFPNDPFSSFIN